jgi:large subunit ribosomal protein L18e|tara:strand:- start:20832 stop:21185 length:354 start_codon:yes stop_codon:yes gene_type:complete
MKLKKTNPRILGLIKSLYEKSEGSKTGLWRALAQRLEGTNQNWATPNLSRLSRITSKGESIVVPGKVLGTGNLDHSVNIYAVSASMTAISKITKSGSSFGSIEDLLTKGSKGVRLVK